MYTIILNEEKKTCCIYEIDNNHSTFLVNVEFKIDEKFVTIKGWLKRTFYEDKWIKKDELKELYQDFENVNNFIVERMKCFSDYFFMKPFFRIKEFYHVKGFLQCELIPSKEWNLLASLNDTYISDD